MTHPSDDRAGGLPRWLAGLAVLAATKLAVGSSGLLLPAVRARPGSPIPPEVFVVVLAVFAASGAFLLLGGRNDRRAGTLGVFFLATASTFADRGLFALGAAFPRLGPVSAVLYALQLEALGPFLLWSFASDFPRVRTFGWLRHLPRLAIRASLGVGVALFAYNALTPLVGGPADPSEGGLHSSFLRHGNGSAYWLLILSLLGSAVAFALLMSRRARVEERRRIRLLLAGLVAGVFPLVSILGLRALVPAFDAWSRDPESVRALGWIIYPGLLAVPVATAYAVVVQHALDVRLVVRRAIQYGIARGSALLAISLPAVVLLALVYRRREQPIAALFSGPGAPAALVAAGAALIAFSARKPLLTAVDRRFFREQYDTRRVLTDVAERSRTAEDPVQLGALLRTEMDRALHLDAVRFLRIDPTTEYLVAPTGDTRSLSGASTIANQVRDRELPVTVDWSDRASWVHRLPDSERVWLADSGARLLTGLLGQSGDLIGLVVLGDKKSELPYTAEDKRLIGAISASASVALDRWLLVTSSRPPPDPDGPSTTRPLAAARECPACDAVYGTDRERCPDCGEPTRVCGLPRVLAGRYRVERRLGGGGMGVVYSAVDGVLGREVAIKTLPPASPQYAQYLRREARAFAAVSHRNLAAIFDYESWQGIPVLVLEYLEGGTLADRVPDRRLSTAEALDVGGALAGALGQLHAEGMLHRDIKPSNVGFARQGTPKLMDFGLASSFGLANGKGSPEDPIAGTIPYMSPEALNNEPAEPHFDLWSLAVTLYEGLSGRNPYAGGSALATLMRIQTGPPPDLRIDVPDCPGSLAEYFLSALALDPRDRPATAGEVERRLLALRSSLVDA